MPSPAPPGFEPSSRPVAPLASSDAAAAAEVRLIVVSGPPLPGRSRFAHALAQRRGCPCIKLRAPLEDSALASAAGPDGEVILEGAFATRAARANLLQLTSNALLVEWQCPRAEAQREAFRRYAGRPRPIAQAVWRAWERDRGGREDVSNEVAPARYVRILATDGLAAQLALVEPLLPTPRGPPAPPSRPVLIVDDDPDFRGSLRAVLEELGYPVVDTASAEQAATLLAAGLEPALLVVDQRLPGRLGTELIATLRAGAGRLPSTPALLLTAFGDPLTCDEALRAQADDVFSKPLRVVDLARAVGLYLGDA